HLCNLRITTHFVRSANTRERIHSSIAEILRASPERRSSRRPLMRYAIPTAAPRAHHASRRSLSYAVLISIPQTLSAEQRGSKDRARRKAHPSKAAADQPPKRARLRRAGVVRRRVRADSDRRIAPARD